MARTPNAVGASTVPDDRIMLENTTAKPNRIMLHSTICSRCWVSCTTAASVMNIDTIGPERR